MKRYIIGLFVFFVGILFVLSTANAEAIHACFKRNNGQLRIAGGPEECLNSEEYILLGETNNQDPSPIPDPVPEDNSKFYGIYGLFEKLDSGGCGNFIIVAINGDPSMQSANYYLYIPRDLAPENSFVYEYTDYHDNTDMKVTVTVDDNKTVTMTSYHKKNNETPMREWVSTRTFTFSDDYSTFTMSGYNGDQTPPECMGDISGYGQRISDIN